MCNGYRVRLTRRCLPEEQLFIRILTAHSVLWGDKSGNVYSRLIIRNRLELGLAGDLRRNYQPDLKKAQPQL